MFNQIFVSYLIEKSVLTFDESEEVLEEVRDTRVRIGVLAVEADLMSQADVEYVNRLQSAKNARFGDIAIEEGYLTKEQFDGLLNNQPKSHVVLKQVLVDREYMASDEFEDALCDFQKSLRVSSEVYELLQDNNVEAFITHIAGIDKRKNIAFHKFAEIFITMVIRLVERDVFLHGVHEGHTSNLGHFISQKGHGDGEFKFAFGTNDTCAATEFAEAYCKFPINSMDEDAVDSLKEFLNCVCGVLIAELSNSKTMELDIDVPEYFKDKSLCEDALVLPFSLPKGEFCLTVC